MAGIGVLWRSSWQRRRGQVHGGGISAVCEEERGLVALEVLPFCGCGEGGAEDCGAGGGGVGCDVAVGGWEGVWDGGHGLVDKGRCGMVMDGMRC